MKYNKAAVRRVMDRVRSERRTSLSALECKRVCDAYAIPTPREGLAKPAKDAAKLAALVRCDDTPWQLGERARC